MGCDDDDDDDICQGRIVQTVSEEFLRLDVLVRPCHALARWTSEDGKSTRRNNNVHGLVGRLTYKALCLRLVRRALRVGRCPWINRCD